MNKGTQQSLFGFGFSYSLVQPTGELDDISGCTIGLGGFGVCPEVLHRIEFGGVGREEFRMYSFSPLEECLNQLASVYCSSVPKQNDMPLKVLFKSPEKGNGISGLHVTVSEADIQACPSLLMGEGYGSHGRYTVLFKPVPDNRRFSPGSPGTSDARKVV